jgi:Zn-dependent protease with chaperone function
VNAVAVEPSTNPGRRVAGLLALVSVGPALVGLLIGLAAGGALGGVVGLVVLAVATPLVFWWRAGRLALGPPGSRPADPGTDARLLNLAEGLCVTAGVKLPDLRVVEAEGLNLAVVGRDEASATVVVTSRLLEQLTRMELEGVVAVAVTAIRQRDLAPATLSAAAFGLGAGYAVGPGRDPRLDDGSVTLTRYPPGLASAYEKFKQLGTVVPAVPRPQAHLWLADPSPAGTATAGYRTALVERIDALNDL